MFFNKSKKLSKEKVVGATIKVEGELSKSFDGKVESVKILGSGCAKCNKLEKNAINALNKVGIDIKVEHISDFAQISQYGVMSTPALVINEKVVSTGKVLSEKDIMKIVDFN